MKKLVFTLVAVAAMSFASCGNKPAEPAPIADVEEVAVVDDSLDGDSIVEEVEAEVEAEVENAPEAE